MRDRDEQEARVEELKNTKLALVAELERLSSQRDVEAGQARSTTTVLNCGGWLKAMPYTGRRPFYCKKRSKIYSAA